MDLEAITEAEVVEVVTSGKALCHRASGEEVREYLMVLLVDEAGDLAGEEGLEVAEDDIEGSTIMM